jgi:hypothetical protein
VENYAAIDNIPFTLPIQWVFLGRTLSTIGLGVEYKHAYIGSEPQTARRQTRSRWSRCGRAQQGRRASGRKKTADRPLLVQIHLRVLYSSMVRGRGLRRASSRFLNHGDLCVLLCGSLFPSVITGSKSVGCRLFVRRKGYRIDALRPAACLKLAPLGAIFLVHISHGFTGSGCEGPQPSKPPAIVDAAIGS